MKRLGYVLSLVLIVFSQTKSTPLLRPLKVFTLEEVIPLQPEFYPDRLSVQWVSDTEYINREPGVGLKKYNALTNTEQILLNETELFILNNYSVSSFSEDGNLLLLSSNRKKGYRYSSTAEYTVYDLQQKLLCKLSKGPIQVVVWGSGRDLAYVKDNNVYYVPDGANPDVTFQLTTAGVPGEIYYGVADWIYEEEILNSAEALWFSPDSAYLAVASFNDTDVESAIYPYYGDPLDPANQYPELVKFKYPKAGRTNPKVELHVFKLNDLQTEAWNIPTPFDPSSNSTSILGQVTWATEDRLFVQWLNRRQNNSLLVNCDLTKDECSIFKEHIEPKGWVDITPSFYDNTGKKLVEIQPLYNGDQRYFHVARLDFDTSTTEDLSPGNSTVVSIAGWNQKTDTVYYIVSPENAPWERQLWATTAGVVRCLSCKLKLCRHVVAMFSSGASFGVISCSASNVPPSTYFFTAKDESFKLLVDNNGLSQKLNEYRMPIVLFNVINLSPGVVAHVKLMIPVNMEEGAKHPMIVRVYAGPGTSRVKDNFDLDFYSLYLSGNRSFVVASIDVRGSSVMGVEAMHALNRALGTVEVTDTLEAIRKILILYPFIDPNRVGVWGWSYGGFVSTMMLVKDEQKILTCAAAVAPVTSWLYYDSIYTERYMDIPANNPSGYRQSELLALAPRLRGRKYLLVHGTGDDNVHFQNSLQLAKKLQQMDIEFEEMIYADENHSLQGVSRHLYHTLEHFWTECFAS